MTQKEMTEKGLLMVPDLNYGFNHYPYEIITLSPPALKQFLLAKITENGWENSYVDFYYGELSTEQQDNVEAMLEAEQREYLAGMKFYPGEVYFPLDRELFELTFLLSVREGLFSTYYFGRNPCTVWSNYSGRFVVFYQEQN